MVRLEHSAFYNYFQAHNHTHAMPMSNGQILVQSNQQMPVYFMTPNQVAIKPAYLLKQTSMGPQIPHSGSKQTIGTPLTASKQGKLSADQM